MEQPSEKPQEEEQIDGQSQELIGQLKLQNLAETNLDVEKKSFKQADDQKPPDTCAESSEAVQDLDDNCEKIQVFKDESERPGSAEVEHIKKNEETEKQLAEAIDKKVIEKQELKGIEELEESIAQLNTSGDQLLTGEDESKDQQLPINLEVRLRTNSLGSEKSSENEEKPPEISVSAIQHTGNVEAAPAQHNDQKEAEPDPNEDTQDELNQAENKECLGSAVKQHKIPVEQREDASKHPEEDLPNEQVTQFLRQLVSQLWPELGANPELRLERASAKGDNYLGVVWRLQAATDSKRSLVVKLPPQNRVRRKQFFARPCFLRETAAYEVFLPLTEMIQEKWKIPGEDRFRQHALCFGTRQDEPNECIVLEDLSCAGFFLHNRFLDLSVEHVRRVMLTYAKLHAISLAGKCQFPDRMQELQQLVDIFEQRREDHALGVYFENLKGSALSALLAPEDDFYRVRLEAYFAKGSYFQLLLPLVSGSNCEPFAVMCHGDCWNNNILYKSAQRGELEDVRLIDWQLMRYASPVTDLSYFLFTCTSREFRQSHLKNMLEDYYEELGQQLIRLGEQVEQLFPRPAFDEQVATKAAVGLLLAMMVLPIVTMQGQDVPDLQAISERIEAGATTDLHGAGFLGAGNEATFKQRIREVILDCVDFNYI
ncbi:uncharacterized protein LOC120456074 [Drosophila santomea]|uniref:uncharacterized protein LOC120456074 n=1 Tax=Drosophila santomea TaxID=129105 RepID=UPI0019536508|nr:uncharacterized protein LOC120456074 [Drosophila santomea]